MSKKKKPSLAEARPDLAAQWHPTLNGELTPGDVTCGSDKEVMWFLPYDDPKTGKHFDFVWCAEIRNRTNGDGCPYLSGKEVWPGYNDLATWFPEIAAQWHPTLNGDLRPDMVTCHSGKKAWWVLLYDDPETGKHFEFVWDDYIFVRTRGDGCPFLAGKRVWPGYNDLATKRPDLAAQWHPTLNGDLTPDQVTCGSNTTVYWLLPYDDPETGKHFDFVWPSKISNRIRAGCPFLAGRQVWPGYNDLASKRPDLAAQWHLTLNGDVMPDQVVCGSNTPVYWLLPYDDPETGKHFDFVWEASPNERVRGSGCPFLSGQQVWPGYNDLATKRPDLAAQWHPTLNGDLTPDQVTCGSNVSVYWLLPYDDPETGKHFDFVWDATVKNRSNGTGCPFLSGSQAWPGYNDLAIVRPDLASQWHPTLNGKLTPEQVTCYCNKKVSWFLPYDDPKTGKHFDFVWEERICNRTKGRGCPFLSGKQVWLGYNDLATRFPEIAAQWHPTLNGNLTPEKVTFGSGKRVHWLLPYDDPETGKHFDFVWRERVSWRTNGYNCPFLSGKAVYSGYNDLETCYPDVAKDWHPRKNRNKKACLTHKGANTKVWWLCSVCGHEWRRSVLERTYEGSSCPKCRENRKKYFA